MTEQRTTLEDLRREVETFRLVDPQNYPRRVQAAQEVEHKQQTQYYLLTPEPGSGLLQDQQGPVEQHDADHHALEHAQRETEACQDDWWNLDGKTGAGLATASEQRPPGLFPDLLNNPPPPVPLEMRRQQLEGGSRMAREDIPHGRWKLLNDVPKLGPLKGEAWEVNMMIMTWKRQFLQVCRTVREDVHQRMEAAFAEAEQRHERRAQGEMSLEEPTSVPGEMVEIQNRLTIALMRSLPQDSQTPVLEGADTTDISPVTLWESLLEVHRPGGEEEVRALLSYIRGLTAVNTAKDGLEVLRRWKLARTRLSQLNIPSVAPSEEARALGALIKSLERKYATLQTRMSLLRLTGNVQRPTAEGVQAMMNAIEQELRPFAAEECLRAAKTAEASGSRATADQATPPKASKGVCHFWNTPGGCTRGRDCPFTHEGKGRNAPGTGRGNGGKNNPKGDGGKNLNSKGSKSSGNSKGSKSSNPKGQNKGKDQQQASQTSADKQKTANQAAPASPQLLGANQAAAKPKADSKANAQARAVTSVATGARVAAAMVTEGAAVNIARSFDDPPMVLLDSGANEVIRPITESMNTTRMKVLTLQVANGDRVEAWRTKDGEVAVPSGANEWILPMKSLVKVGGAVSWSSDIPDVWVPVKSGGRRRAKVTIRNNLPYMEWDDFRHVRVLLSQRWKATCKHRANQVESTSVPQQETVVLTPDEYIHHMFCQEENECMAQSAAHGGAVMDGEAEAAKALQNQEFDHASIRQVVWSANLKKVASRSGIRQDVESDTNDFGSGVWHFGLFTRGPCPGITSLSLRRPQLTKYLATALRHHSPESTFTALSISLNTVLAPHQDARNDVGSWNTVLGITSCRGGELWVEVSQAEAEANPEDIVWRRVAEDKPKKPGRLHPTAEEVCIFDPKRWHGTEAFVGDRVILVGFNPGGASRVPSQLRAELEHFGFPTTADAAQRSEESSAARADMLPNPRLQGDGFEAGEVCDVCGDVVKGAQEGFCGVIDVPAPWEVDATVPSVGSHGDDSLKGDSHEAIFEEETRQVLLQDLKKCCHHGAYQPRCPGCVKAKGHRRPHRRLMQVRCQLMWQVHIRNLGTVSSTVLLQSFI